MLVLSVKQCFKISYTQSTVRSSLSVARSLRQPCDFFLLVFCFSSSATAHISTMARPSKQKKRNEIKLLARRKSSDKSRKKMLSLSLWSHQTQQFYHESLWKSYLTFKSKVLTQTSKKLQLSEAQFMQLKITFSSIQMTQHKTTVSKSEIKTKMKNYQHFKMWENITDFWHLLHAFFSIGCQLNYRDCIKSSRQAWLNGQDTGEWGHISLTTSAQLFKCCKENSRQLKTEQKAIPIEWTNTLLSLMLSFHVG